MTYITFDIEQLISTTIQLDCSEKIDPEKNISMFPMN